MSEEKSHTWIQPSHSQPIERRFQISLVSPTSSSIQLLGHVPANSEEAVENKEEHRSSDTRACARVGTSGSGAGKDSHRKLWFI
jgi:hypothetical protein